jgi:hypothetical protein
MALLIILDAIIKKDHTLEGFTPRLKQAYRPLARNIRIVGEGFYNRTKQKMSNIFRSTFSTF